MSEDLSAVPPAQFSIKSVLRRTFAVIRSNISSFGFVAVVLILVGHIQVLLVDRHPDDISWWNIAIILLGRYVLGGCAGAALTWFVQALTIIAGCILFVLWFGAAPAAIAEGLGVLAALGRSTLLTGGRRLHLFVLIFMGSLAFQVPAAWAWKIAGTVPPGSESTSLLLLLWTTQQILPVVALIFWAVAGTVMYCTLRLAKEGASVQQVAQVFE